MDMKFSEEELTFQREARAFLATAWELDLKPAYGDAAFDRDIQLEWQYRLHRQGWMAPAWPQEYGGTDWTVTQHFIWETERTRAGAPDTVPFGVKMVGPVIYTYGSQAQKDQFLPRILNSQDWWCQGYSEPGAGSDLASLRTRADLEGDEYIINGTKIWTSFAHYADWMFCLVRTTAEGPKQAGISFLLIEMNSPGISVIPITTMDGEHHLNQVQFDNVRVPVANRIGEQDKGWTYAKSLLALERSAIAGVAGSKCALAEVRELAARETNGGKRLLDNSFFQVRLAEADIELMALEVTEMRVLSAAAGGAVPGPESSILKLKGTVIQQALQELYMEIAAHYGGLLPDHLNVEDVGHDFGSTARQRFLLGRAASIYGGSTEVQKTIVAKSVLGLR